MEEATDVLARILDAATEEFGRAGYAGAKVEAIARRAGVNKAGLYYHVGNKEKLYEAVLLRLFGQVAASLEQASQASPASTDPVAAFSALTVVLAGLFTRLPMLPRIMAMEMASGGAHMPAAAMAEFRRIFGVTRQLLVRGADLGMLRPAEPVFVHLTLVGSLIVYCLPEPLRQRFAAAAKDLGLRLDLPVENMAAFLAEVVGRGLAKVPDAPAAPVEESHEGI